MIRNLVKAPLIAVLYAALVWFVAAFVPRSEAYAAAAAAFTMPMTGLLLLVGCALIPVIAWALVFLGEQRGGVVFMLMLGVSTIGLQWVVPSLRQLLLGDVSGVMSRSDLLLQAAGCAGATVLILLLAALLYRTSTPPEIPEAPADVPEKGKRGKGKAPENAPEGVTYKLGVLGLIIRLLVLPVIYFVLYYLSWYFLFWQQDAAREYHGAEASENFMAAFIDILINRGGEALITLLVGLAFALFCLPLLFRLKGKRLLFILVVTLLYLTGALAYLVPSPIMPSAVRMAHLMETGAVMLLYGVISGVLLHTSFRKIAVAEPEPEPEPVRKPQPKGQRPAQKPQPKPAPAAAEK